MISNEEIIALLKKNPITAGGIVLAVLLAGGIYFRSGEIPAAEAELAQKSAEAERYALNIKNSAQLKEQLESITAANKAIDGRMVRVSQLAINKQYFEVLRRDTGVNLIDFRQATMAANLPKNAKTAFVPVAFGVSVQGTLPQVMNFLRSLEEGAHFCRILTASCSVATGNRGSNLTLQLNLELLGLP